MTRSRCSTDRRQAIASFYGEHHEQLRHAVRRRVAGGTPEVIDDACQIAWMLLVKRPDVALDRRGFGWLVVVAVREGWELARVPRHVPSGSFMPVPAREAGVLREPAGDASDPAELAIDREQHRERVDALAQLKPRERRDLFLFALGYRYREIAEATGSTYTAVNRRVTEGRARLRDLAVP